MKNFMIKSGKHIYLVKANDSDEALKKVEEYVSDERLSPMTYAKLKEMGYGHEDWKDLTQEKANEIVAKGEQASQSKKERKAEATKLEKSAVSLERNNAQLSASEKDTLNKFIKKSKINKWLGDPPFQTAEDDPRYVKLNLKSAASWSKFIDVLATAAYESGIDYSQDRDNNLYLKKSQLKNLGKKYEAAEKEKKEAGDMLKQLRAQLNQFRN